MMSKCRSKMNKDKSNLIMMMHKEETKKKVCLLSMTDIGIGMIVMIGISRWAKLKY